MKKNRSSRTAEIVTAWKAAESLQPADDRICNDELAGKLIHPVYQFIGAFDILRKLGIWYSERVAPGIPGFVIARTRYIDDHLQACIHEGLEQLVILGAGLDSRAYRFQPLATTPLRVFEVDHPATQQVKIQRVLKALGNIPKHVTYVPIDFDRESLDQKLTAAGYSPHKKTFFIWEGVVTYLTAEAVDNTLAFVTQNSGPGSSIIMSYIFKSVIDDSQAKDEETLRFRKALQKKGEPATFGIDDDDVETFLTSRGFTRIIHVSMSSLEKRYFLHQNRHQRIFPWAGIAHAIVRS